MVRVEFVHADIATLNVDAVVNSAPSVLLYGGTGCNPLEERCVHARIHQAAGERVLAECTQLRRNALFMGLETGLAVATTAGNLPASWIIHTCAPRYDASQRAAVLLARSHISCVRTAAELGARTLAFPPIATGALGYPAELAAPVAITSVVGEAENMGIDELIFAFLTDSTRQIYQAAWSALPGHGPRRPSSSGCAA